MKLEQNQLWCLGNRFLRIVRVERLAVEYKEMTNLLTQAGTHRKISKKEFCRLIKPAVLMTQDEFLAAWRDQDLRDKNPRE